VRNNKVEDIYADLIKGTIGFQLGGQATGAQAPTRYSSGMAIFVHAKGGLMYEATIGGQKFSFKPLK